MDRGGARMTDNTFEQQLHGPGSSPPSRFAASDSWSFTLSGSDVAAGGGSDDIDGEVVMSESWKKVILSRGDDSVNDRSKIFQQSLVQ